MPKVLLRCSSLKDNYEQVTTDVAPPPHIDEAEQVTTDHF